MKIKTVRELFLNELADSYNSEKQLTDALPAMAEAASDPALSQAFTSHLSETETHVARLAEIFEILGEDIRKEKCEATQGLVKEAEEFIKHIEKGSVLDAALIAAAQKVEHYEIASYGTLSEMAKLLGYTEVAEILEKTLSEEKGADKKLNTLALTSINDKALVGLSENTRAVA